MNLLLISSFSGLRKTLISNDSDIDKKNLYQKHHVIRNLSTDKLSSKEIYSILISNIINKTTWNINFEKLFENTILDWSEIYLLPRLQLLILPAFFPIQNPQ